MSEKALEKDRYFFQGQKESLYRQEEADFQSDQDITFQSGDPRALRLLMAYGAPSLPQFVVYTACRLAIARVSSLQPLRWGDGSARRGIMAPILVDDP